ncbi:hypothetical protein BC936DRAFT_147029 [Jimgerdemannia flammicorona]|uniref:Uncharacterized protein n=1 Tax=Jimgerdemannia flammicorona TaxID=994334 RepID=A0A433D6C6_9FUNG|nr:hypothetical protein BC936DRAFT_147029 [Jimgerdemannia flammicorona]
MTFDRCRARSHNQYNPLQRRRPCTKSRWYHQALPRLRQFGTPHQSSASLPYLRLNKPSSQTLGEIAFTH